MKMLNALVGYLAVIASAPSLPYPFAFASPLATHYDGYLNSTATQNTIDLNGALTEHFIGTIVETCQTVNIQSLRETHCDSALMKRVPGDIQVIEARQGEVVPVAAVVTAVVASVAVALAIIWVKLDNPVRCNLKFLVKTLIKSLLPLADACSVYPKYYQPDVIEVSALQLGYLPLPLFHRV